MFDVIQFPYNWVATAQAAAFWLTIYDSHLHWQYLMYLLYLSDRIHLIKYGNPITGDSYICIEGKPVLLNTIELLHHNSFSPLVKNPKDFWQHYFTAPNNEGTVGILTHPGMAELSRSMEDVMNTLFNELRNFDLDKLRQYFTSLSECKDLGYPRRIEVYGILAKNGYELEDLIAIKNEASREWMFAKAEEN